MRPQASGWLCPACAHDSDAQTGDTDHGDTGGDTDTADDGSFSAGMGFAAADHLGFTSGRTRERDAGKGSFDDS